MGGYHLSGRRFTSESYTGVHSYLKLPDRAETDINKLSYPRFGFTFWRSGVGGLNMGIGYGTPKTTDNSRWQIYACGAVLNTSSNRYSVPNFNATLGTTIRIDIQYCKSIGPYGGYRLRVLNPGSSALASYDVHLTLAGSKLGNGASVVRETLLASNSSGTNYLNGTAKFEFAKWYYGTLYRANGTSQALLGGSMDAIKSDDGSSIPTNRYKRDCGTEVWNGRNYDYEIISGTFVTPPVLKVEW